MTNDRLSSLDASFLYLDGATTPMHISSLGIYEGPVPTPDELRDALDVRLHLVPRFRQRVVRVPFNQHRPLWRDDPTFDLEGHLRHVATPPPGTDAQLMDLCGRLLSLPLDPSRPLWEMWLVDGLGAGRFAILSKTHHALWDGVTGADLHTVLLDTTPQPNDPTPVPWKPRALPSPVSVLLKGVRDRAREPLELAAGARRALRSPQVVLQRAANIAQGAVAYGRTMLERTPPSPFNVPIGSRRRYEVVRSSLADIKRVGKRYGTSVNDVVLAVVAGTLRAWLIRRNIVPQDLRVMVPVSIRTEDDRGTLGNRVAMLVVPLPVGEDDPVRRLEIAHEVMGREKRSKQVRAEELVTMLGAFAPPQVLAQLTRIQSLRWFNLLVTNIPGPQFPLYLRGRRLLELFPQAPLAANQGLAVAAMSYDGRMGFGLLADRDAVPNLDELADDLCASIDALIEAAGPTFDPDGVTARRAVLAGSNVTA